MSREKSPEDLTVDELRQLMVEKRRKVRQQHLERFRKTGRVVTLASDLETPPLTYMHSDTNPEPANLLELTETRRKRRVLDRFLLAIEILAVVGLIFVIYTGVRLLGDLNKEFSTSLIIPTLTPTPLIVPVVLPSGHTPPNSPGGAQPNVAEIPPNLMPVYQSMANIPIPTPGPEQAVQIQIPTIKVDAPIVQGDSWEQLKKGVAQSIGTGNPGQPGNMVLSAHNDVFGELFRYLDQLKPGDEIIVITAHNAFTYNVTDVEIVKPSNVEVMAATVDPTITLISCYPYMIDNQRIIVKADLVGDSN